MDQESIVGRMVASTKVSGTGPTSCSDSSSGFLPLYHFTNVSAWSFLFGTYFHVYTYSPRFAWGGRPRRRSVLVRDRG